MNLKTGLNATSTFKIKSTETAKFIKSGSLPVLATPVLCAYIEETCVKASENHLPKGFTTVGFHIELDHIAPSAVNSEISVVAKLIHVDGKNLEFEAIAKEKTKTIGHAKHLRMIVNEKNFMSKLSNK